MKQQTIQITTSPNELSGRCVTVHLVDGTGSTIACEGHVEVGGTPALDTYRVRVVCRSCPNENECKDASYYLTKEEVEQLLRTDPIIKFVINRKGRQGFSKSQEEKT